MKKPLLLLLLLGGIAVHVLAGASAFAYTIEDESISYERDSRNWTYFDTTDVVGDPAAFSVYGINVGLNDSKVRFELFSNVDFTQSFTKADGTTYNYYLSDLAIGAPGGTFGYGLVLYNHDSWTAGDVDNTPSNTLSVGLYEVTDWYTADELNLEDGYDQGTDSEDAGVLFGSLYSDAGAWNETLVAIESGTLLESIDITQTLLGGTGDSPKYVYTIEFDYAAIAGLGSQLEVLWSGDSSGSDAIRGMAAVPEPGTLALLGLGLLGLCRVVSRRGTRAS